MQSRLPEIDFLRCVFIVLMVAFHLVYIEESYPYAKRVVYTFHMPGFLFLSGYLARPYKSWKDWGRKMWWIFVPYVCMEAGYVAMSHWLPVRGGAAELGWGVFLEKIFLHPLGPYWYLHTWMLCLAGQWVVWRLPCVGDFPKLVLLGLGLWGMQEGGLLSFPTVIYFLLGCAVRCAKWTLAQVFQLGWVAVVPLVVLCCYPQNLDRRALGGVCIVYFCMSFLWWIYRRLPGRVERVCVFVGSNTLPILLFSPIFTFLSKGVLPCFAFEPSGLLFAGVAVSAAVWGSIGLAWLLDKCRLSVFFVGKEKFVTNDSGKNHLKLL